MLGGGTFLVQNKVLPGTYINYVSIPRPSNIFGDRGYAAIAIPLKWGADFTVVGNEELQKDSLKLFGVSFDSDVLTPIREALQFAKTLYVGRLGGGSKASVNQNGIKFDAKYAGSLGNNLSVKFEAVPDNKFMVRTFLNGLVVDEQVVSSKDDLLSNDYIDFSCEATVKFDELSKAEVKLAGGSDTDSTTEDHVKFISELETRYFNVVGYYGIDDKIAKLYASFIKRLRDEVGKKAQAVLFKTKESRYNYEGIVQVNSEAEGVSYGFIPWVTGALAGIAVNKSLDNVLYGGEMKLTKKSGSLVGRDLERAIIKGEFVFHRVDDDVRVLQDINSFTEFSPEKNEDFAQNQNIRVLDQIAMDVSKIFGSRYLGKVQNNKDGRVSLWADITNHANTLQKLGAIEDFVPEDVVVNQGLSKDSVDVSYVVKPVMAMRKLYMVIRVN